MTRVIFRKCKGEFKGEIVAFFPDTYNRYNGNMTCYAHIGQHSDANIRYYWDTVKATEEEYKPLLDELTNVIGYDDLKVMQKMTYK